jgi:hypothetical protein
MREQFHVRCYDFSHLFPSGLGVARVPVGYLSVLGDHFLQTSSHVEEESFPENSATTSVFFGGGRNADPNERFKSLLNIEVFQDLRISGK